METVANYSGNSLTTYPESANGNVAPTNTISGSMTGLNSPYGLPYGVHWVKSTSLTILAVACLVFAGNASGNAAPVANIGGGKHRP
jgi:hypothetical protein